MGRGHFNHCSPFFVHCARLRIVTKSIQIHRAREPPLWDHPSLITAYISLTKNIYVKCRMGCSFGSPAGAVGIRFRNLYAPQNLNLERLPEKPRSVNNNECRAARSRRNSLRSCRRLRYWLKYQQRVESPGHRARQRCKAQWVCGVGAAERKRPRLERLFACTLVLQCPQKQ